MSHEWYASVMGSEVGPMNSIQLREMAKAGQIGPGDFVRRGPTGNWVDVAEVQGLQFVQQPVWVGPGMAASTSSIDPESASAFRNPANGYEVDVGSPFVWAFLFGVFYFAYKGVWIHAIIGLALAFMTFGLSWIVYPFFARKVIVQHYLNKGWIPLA